jgi:ubiquinone/menaquinone biosynthesis C-methylase UbiE
MRAGLFLARYASQVGRVCGLDLSPTQIAMARRRLRARLDAGSAEIVEGDAVELPWPDATFTVVTCMGSVELFPDPQAALQEMQPVLRPGGRLALTMGAGPPHDRHRRGPLRCRGQAWRGRQVSEAAGPLRQRRPDPAVGAKEAGGR